MSDLISRQAAIDAVHKSIFDFFDICDDDEESPMTYKDKQLLKLNKAITTQIKAVASAQLDHNPDDERKIADLHKIVNYLLSQPERKKGKWVGIDDYPHESWECDQCGCVYEEMPSWTPNFCPNCGAEMSE